MTALYQAYQALTVNTAKDLLRLPPVVPLRAIYELLTILPYQEKYAKPEFTRDVYLLHRSGTDTTRSGAKVEFNAPSSGVRASDILSVINESGQERRYYGVSFTLPAREV